MDQRNLTLHEIVALAYDREFYKMALPDWKEKSFDDLFNFYDDLSFEIIMLYVPIVDDLRIADRVKKFVYDSKTDLVSVILDDESKVLLPFTKEDVKYLSDQQKDEATQILLRELFPWDNRKLEKWVSSRGKRTFYRYFDSIPHPERFSKVPQKLSKRLKRFCLSISLPDEEEGVFTRHHLSLSDDMKIAEDLFNLGFHGLLFDGHPYVESILCYFDTRVVHEFPYQLFSGGPYRCELNLVALEDEHDLLRKKEIEELFQKYDSWDRKNVICELVQRESKRMFMEHSSLFRTDREYLLFKDDKIARGNKEMHDFYQRIRRPDPQKGVYTRHYESLSDTEKIIQDLFNLAFHGMKDKMLYDVSTFVLEPDGSSFAAFAINKDFSRTELPLYGYDQDDDDERELDVAALMEGKNTEEYREEIAKRFNEESKKFFSGEDTFLKTDKKY